MPEESEEVERGAERDSPAAGGDGPDVERAAESFLDVESALSGSDLAGPIRGRAIDVERVPAVEVPEGYPVDIRTDEALALALDVDGDRAVVYFEWDETITDDRLGRLLALQGIPPGRFARLHGETIFLELRDGHYVPVVPGESPRGSSLGVYGIVAGLGANVLTLLFGLLGSGVVGSAPVLALWLLANLVVLPGGTYLDAWHLRTHTDWEGGPLFWTALAVLPGLNVLASIAYLAGRARATPLA